MSKSLGMLSLAVSLCSLPMLAGTASAKQVAGKETANMQQQIEKSLTTDAELKNNRIEVSVDNSVATLKGKVDTSAEKTKAEELAHVNGVVRVDNQLEVGSDGAGAAVSDTLITTKVKAALMGEDQLKGSDISVATNNGVVVLTGRAASQAASDYAMALAQKTNGVKTVANKLHVPPAK